MTCRLATALAAFTFLACAAGPAQSQRFVDVAGRAGVTPVIISGSPEKTHVLEVNGSGVCWLDYDGDGFQDLYLVNGGTIEELLSGEERSPNYLFRNNGDGTFTDVTRKAGVAGRGWGFGCVAADYDNDGHADLFVTNYGPDLLFRNNGDGTFSEVAAKAGVAGGDVWRTGAAFADYDNDGHLDLYAAGYLEFDIRNPPKPGGCEYRGVPVKACGPLGFRGAPDALYRNNGDGTFTDVTVKAGVTDRSLYYGFTVIFEDFDNDGWPDIFVANDSNPSYLYHNQGDGTFEEIGVASGVGYSGDGKAFSDMGVAAGDYNNNGLTDLFVTTFADDNYALFRNDGGGFFTDLSYPSGLGEPTIPWLGWAAMFLDYDHDGTLDLFVANGHVYPEVDGVDGDSYEQPLQLFENLSNGKFRDASQKAGLDRLPRVSARGGAACDFDNDGDVDIVVSRIDGRPLVLLNEGPPPGNWLLLKLVGTKSNRDAIGALAKVETGGMTQYRRVRAGDNYLSSSDQRLHFGLGSHAAVDRIEIRWPSGAVEALENVKTNRILTIREGEGIAASASR